MLYSALLMSSGIEKRICNSAMHSNGNIVRILDFTNDYNAVQTSNAINVAKSIKHEILIVFHVTCIHLNLKVVVTRCIVGMLVNQSKTT